MDTIDDDLNAPLGQFRVRTRPPLGKFSHTGVAGVVFGGLGLFAIATDFPPMFGGLAPPGPPMGTGSFAPPAAAKEKTPLHETAPRETTPRQAMASPPTALPQQPVAGLARNVNAPVQEASHPSPPVLDPAPSQGVEAIERRSGVKIIRPGGGAPPGALIINVAKALNKGLTPAPDPRLIEPARYGDIPRIGADGARPAEIYARPAVPLPGRPRIALLVGGMGLSPRAAEAAIASLPGEVTLGFAPYGADLASQAALAREAGHELVLEIPMEPFDFPQDNPGPHTLVTEAGPATNSDNLSWLMSRFAGYAGVVNFLGGKFTADAKALTPVLHEIAARGLFYMDDGTSAQSLAMALAPGQDLTAARADIVLDSMARPGAIEAALARLEAIAREKGLAIGVASALPSSLETIGRFARSLEVRGIALVPLSAAMPRPQQGARQQEQLPQQALVARHL